jgi:hypothetical protein
MPRSRVWRLFVLLLVLPVVACQSPTDSTTTYDVDDIVTSVVTPAHATAAASTDGKNYRVVRGNNQPDEVLLFDWVTTFDITLAITSTATNKDVDLSFPITITSATGRVQQAAGGIVTPPTGGDVEHYDSVLTSSTGSQISAVGGTVTLSFQVWYDLPSLRKESLVTETIILQDADGTQLTKTVNVVVDP